MKALILNGEVVQVEEQDFPVAQPLKWIDVPDELGVVPGWCFDGIQFSPPLPKPPGSGGRGGAGIGGDLNIGGEGGSGFFGGEGGNAIGRGLNIGGRGGRGTNVPTPNPRWNWSAMGVASGSGTKSNLVAAVITGGCAIVAALLGALILVSWQGPTLDGLPTEPSITQPSLDDGSKEDRETKSLTSFFDGRYGLSEIQLGVYYGKHAGTKVKWKGFIVFFDSESYPFVFLSDLASWNSKRILACWLSFDDFDRVIKLGKRSKIEFSGVVAVNVPDTLPSLNNCELGNVIATR